jgi:DeoR family glycerol-3-phosphate regulon repressor
VGASGITAAGAADVDDEAAAVYRAMRLAATRTLIVADHTKFGRAAFAIHAELAEIRRIMTDRPPGGELARLLADAGAEITVAG